jgi:hypothetical protein
MDHFNQSLSRRDALKALAATSGAVALSTIPNRWESPILQVGNLPAFAQGSQETVIPTNGPADYPFENSVPEFGGDLSGLQIAPQDGWLVVAEDGQNVGASDYPWIDYPWIISRPWIRIRRRWNVMIAPWPVHRKIKIKFQFANRTGHGSSRKIKDDAQFWFYGVSGAYPDMYYVSKVKIRGNKIEIEFGLPALGSGFFPFFCSGFFPVAIPLIGGYFYYPGYYLGPGIVGDDIVLPDVSTPTPTPTTSASGTATPTTSASGTPTPTTSASGTATPTATSDHKRSSEVDDPIE